MHAGLGGCTRPKEAERFKHCCVAKNEDDQGKHQLLRCCSSGITRHTRLYLHVHENEAGSLIKHLNLFANNLRLYLTIQPDLPQVQSNPPGGQHENCRELLTFHHGSIVLRVRIPVSFTASLTNTWHGYAARSRTLRVMRFTSNSISLIDYWRCAYFSKDLQRLFHKCDFIQCEALQNVPALVHTMTSCSGLSSLTSCRWKCAAGNHERKETINIQLRCPSPACASHYNTFHSSHLLFLSFVGRRHSCLLSERRRGFKNAS